MSGIFFTTVELAVDHTPAFIPKARKEIVQANRIKATILKPSTKHSRTTISFKNGKKLIPGYVPIPNSIPLQLAFNIDLLTKAKSLKMPKTKQFIQSNFDYKKSRVTNAFSYGQQYNYRNKSGMKEIEDSNNIAFSISNDNHRSQTGINHLSFQPHK